MLFGIQQLHLKCLKFNKKNMDKIEEACYTYSQCIANAIEDGFPVDRAFKKGFKKHIANQFRIDITLVKEIDLEVFYETA